MYYINITEYEKLKVNDIIKSKSELFRKICYPKVKKIGSTEKRLYKNFIDKIVKYEKQENSYKIKITSIEPMEKVKEIIEKTLKYKTDKGIEPRKVYTSHRNYLLDYVIFPIKKDETKYFTSSQIIRKSKIFTDLYYDYCKFYYDPVTSTEKEIENVTEFIDELPVNNYEYFINTIDKLNNIVFSVFNRKVIFNWAESRELEVSRVLYQDKKEISDLDAKLIERDYIHPLEIREIPYKSITKLANMNYIRDNNIPKNKHKWFYYVYKFTNKNNTINQPNLIDLSYHQNEMNKKFIERLEKASIDFDDSHYHKNNIKDLQYTINELKIKI